MLERNDLETKEGSKSYEIEKTRGSIRLVAPCFTKKENAGIRKNLLGGELLFC